MRRKGLVILGFIALLLVFGTVQSCKSNPEQQLLTTYFHAVSLKDTMTMSTMALAPMSIDVESWKIIAVSPLETTAFALADLNQKELELKKKLEDHVGPVMDAEDALYGAQEELKAARTGGAKATAKKRVDEAQAKFDQEREIHRQLQKDYNDAKAAASREEEIAIFSLGAGQLANIRDLTGSVLSKDVDVNVIAKDKTTKDYKFHLKKYELRDEAANLTRRGRWIIVNFEPLS
jgi:hypothetical protein